MHKNSLIVISAALTLILAAPVMAEIISSTSYILDLTSVKEAAKKATWSDPDHISVTPQGIGWGTPDDKASRDFWLRTEPIGIGLSWRPTRLASIKATVACPQADGELYARYSADGKHWTTWQYLEATAPAAGKPAALLLQGTLRIPYRETAAYDKLRLDYASRDDVPWGSDEEALVKEILKEQPKYFETHTPFIGYVQFLYEAQLRGGQRVTSLKVTMDWMVSGKHFPPKDPNTETGRHEVWRFKAP